LTIVVGQVANLPRQDSILPHKATVIYLPILRKPGTSLRHLLRRSIARARLRPAFLFDRVRTRRITAEELHVADSELESLVNANSLEDYSAALVRARVMA
jgi:molybdopterin-guanine dinucleotide biosynthesis protein A